MRRLVVGAALVVLLLTGCADWSTSGGITYAAPAPAPAPVAAPVAVPDVPVVDAALGPVAAPSPQPVRLEVTDVGIDMAVDPVGVADDGAMALPEDANRAGWYEFGPAPSDPAGATLVAAHVDSRQTGIGPFARLRDVPVGSRLTLTTADGVAHRYVVSSVGRTPKADAPVAQWFARDGAPRLVLVTCGGSWSRATQHYSDNVVVTASPVTA